jgi:uncharacterized protein with GYD domain
MATFVLLATFTDQGIRNVKDSVKRAETFKEQAKAQGVTVKEIVYTLGRYDVVAVCEAPDDETASTLTLSLAAKGNVRPETLRAFTLPEMQKMIGKIG